MSMDQFYLIFSSNKCSNRQREKISHGTTINISIIMKTRPFQQQQQNYTNRITRSKEMAEQRLKKDFGVTL